MTRLALEQAASYICTSGLESGMIWQGLRLMLAEQNVGPATEFAEKGQLVLKGTLG